MGPDVRYARNGDRSIAYQVLGAAGPDLVLVPGFVTHLDLAWEDPYLARFLRGLASFSRTTWFDRAGTGLSDPPAERPTLDDAVRDLRCVMRAAGIERAALLGVAVGAAVCTRFAVSWPTEVESLVLWGGHARLLRDVDYPAGWSAEELADVLARIDRDWATGADIGAMNPTLAADERYRTWFARSARAGASPAQARAVFELCASLDLRPELGQVRAPTLLLHRAHDPWLSVEHARYVASHIPGARLVVLPGEDHWPWVGDADAVLAEVEQFVTGRRAGRRRRASWGPDALTSRERDVAALAVQGLSARAIAERLVISERTVETHIAHVYRKLGVASRVELVRRGAELGL